MLRMTQLSKTLGVVLENNSSDCMISAAMDSVGLAMCNHHRQVNTPGSRVDVSIFDLLIQLRHASQQLLLMLLKMTGSK